MAAKNSEHETLLLVESAYSCQTADRNRDSINTALYKWHMKLSSIAMLNC